MKILVCMKQVPQKDAPLKLNESGTWIREDVSYEVNEPDAYALEEACAKKKSMAAKWWSSPLDPLALRTVLREGWPRARIALFIWKITALSGWTHSIPRRRLSRPSKRSNST